MQARNADLSPAELVNACLDEVGSLTVSDKTLDHLVDYADSQGNLRFNDPDQTQASGQRIAEMLQLIVATREYQMT